MHGDTVRAQTQGEYERALRSSVSIALLFISLLVFTRGGTVRLGISHSPYTFDQEKYVRKYFEVTTSWPRAGVTFNADIVNASIEKCAKTEVNNSWSCVEHYAIEGTTTFRKQHSLACEVHYNEDTNFTLRHIRRSLCTFGPLRKRVEMLFVSQKDGGFVLNSISPCASTCPGSNISTPPYDVDFQQIADRLYANQIPWWHTGLIMDHAWGVVPPLLNCSNLEEQISLLPLEERKPVLFWRGSLQNGGHYVELTGPRHPRVQLPILTSAWKDADIKLQLSEDRIKSDEFLSAMPEQNLRAIMNNTWVQWREYITHRYLLLIPGNADSVRLAKMMLSGSLIFFPVDHPYGELYWPMLKPWVHIVPVLTDGSDLRERLTWASSHTEEVKRIISNCLQLALHTFSCENLRRVTANTLYSYADAYDEQAANSKPSDWIIWPPEQPSCYTL